MIEGKEEELEEENKEEYTGMKAKKKGTTEGRE